uniref:Uncharacterized protein n=1 Tax=Anguilla anguilla TaxID=7936 RepID=A0A0E9PQ53_ANGAN
MDVLECFIKFSMMFSMSIQFYKSLCVIQQCFAYLGV